MHISEDRYGGIKGLGLVFYVNVGSEWRNSGTHCSSLELLLKFSLEEDTAVEY